MHLRDCAQKSHIVLDRQVSITDAVAIIDHGISIELHPDAVARCVAAHQRLQQVIAEDRHVYGLTTGFGPLANRLVDTSSGALLQQNLVHHLASGVGPALGWRAARAMVFARLMSILQGASGASELAINALIKLINSELAPEVPSQGTVGASGDLTPLAHMVLCFQGRGAFFDKAGRFYHSQNGLDQLGIAPLDLAQRDGLALVNGTSAMTGIAVLNADLAGRAVGWSIALTAAMAEVQNARTEAWHPAFGTLRPHARQIETAGLLRAALVGSERVERRCLADRILTDVPRQTEERAGQDAYTLRCAPQVIGAVWDMLDWHNQVVTTELNAVTDNPIFPLPHDDGPLVLHGGNFMGQHVGLASDALATGVCVLAGFAERQMARLTDETLNRGLPAFLHQGVGGLNSGLMGAQVTATALVAEMRTQGAASAQSISTNGANQDVVSMGTIAARHVQHKLDMLMRVQAILALSMAQAIDIRSQDQTGLSFSPVALKLQAYVRGISAPLTQDRPLGRDIEAIAKAFAQDAPPS
ncbi:histidine ammonia-lyase [Yoonia maricola]|uniref:Histidine ammonia-lyase n=1 Tax=Yoonia maricola TaxID=420999 RepID=A0A2M8WKJ6_9RHOB|nr:aromatic amino acid ammonia-lyase [Yoonia maricola]PJI91424.1 histidine ammonia-lyase [Yoonia maricola]